MYMMYINYQEMLLIGKLFGLRILKRIVSFKASIFKFFYA